MNDMLERYPWRSGMVLGVVLAALVAGLGGRADTQPWVAVVAGAAAGAVAVVAIGLLGRGARTLGANEDGRGDGQGARRLLAQHPWRSGALVAAVAAAVRGASGVAAGEALAEAALASAMFFAPWLLVLGLLGWAAGRPREDSQDSRDSG